ncbi:unnamed protein product [Adineta ricciae]|uniref:Uncharacterized protein n=1 Tax=Adineta ricciae TaxID=249248 RepID=A0A814BUH8_ADIRI|nr:unnamed protein product [Adineta ricciae]CAF1025034.1 unnamed protein product [Adineta ricciae]
MHLFRGSWNVNEGEVSVHSPVRLLQKLAAYRASTTAPTSATSTPSVSPQNERKPTILTESTNFFARLWRPTTNHPPPSPILITSNEIHSSLTDLAPEYSPALSETSSTLSATPKSTRRISFIREVSIKTSSHLFPFPPVPSSPPLQPSSSSLPSPPPLLLSLQPVPVPLSPPLQPLLPLRPPPPPLRPQPTISSVITDPSFEDTTSEHPCDTASELYSQSFETNIDSSNPGIVDDDGDDDYDENCGRKRRLTYDERQRRLSLSAKPVILLVHQKTSLPKEMILSHCSGSLASPEANIDVSMAMDYLATSMITTQSISNSTPPITTENNPVSATNNLRRKSRSGLRNAEGWARKRALMHRGYQWTTTFEGMESTNNDQTYPNFDNTTSLTDSIPHIDQQNLSPTLASTMRHLKNNESSFSSQDTHRRRRSSRRLPEIPGKHSSSSTTNNRETNLSDEVIFTSSSLHSSNEYPTHPMRENSLSNRSKSIDSDSSLKTRSSHTKLFHTHQSPNAKSVDVSNLARRKSFLVINNTSLLPQRSLDYPCIVRKAPDLSDIVRRRMLYSKISKQQGDTFSISLEREHVPKVPRKIIIRQDNSIEIALSKPPKLRRQTLSEEYYYGCNSEAEFASIAQSTNAASTLGIPLPSSASGGDRRKTIETCENIFLHAEESSKLRARTPPSNPHRILLHRDKNDTSIRTNGLGMRIVGGQECEDGSLGCFVTNLLHGGPADVQGNIEVGDQILEFNGHSLIESTYEEVRILQDYCGDIVQLVVQHNNVRLQISGGQALSSIEISRHFETVPRLASSLTRKRRNLPPLPPSLSSSFPKQQKRDLYETVETLEVPNVKELKPILINRGRLLAQIWHDVEDMKLALTIIQAGNLPLRTNGDQPYTFITGKMLFEDRGFDMFETKVIHSSNPIYNETFVFHEVETVDVLHLEVLLWDKKQNQADRHAINNSTEECDEFLGMIQLPLSEANLEDEPRWYELRDRQTRKPSTSSVTFKSSSAESGDSFRKMPPLVPSSSSTVTSSSGNKHQERTRTSTDLLMRALNRSATNKIDSNRRASATDKRLQRTSAKNPTIPSIIMTSIEDEDNDEPASPRASTMVVQSVKLKRRISKGILKLFDMQTRRHSESSPKSSIDSPTSRKHSSQMPPNLDSEEDIDLPTCGVSFDSTPTVMNKSPRQSIVPPLPPPPVPPSSAIHHDEQQTLIRPIPLQQMPIGQLMLPFIPSSRHSSISGSRKSSAASYCESDEDIDRYFTLTEQQQQHQAAEQMTENNNVQTHTVGPGQVTPRNYENMINDYIYMGQIQLGLIVTKGLLEIDIVCARGLERVINDNDPHNPNNNMTAARNEENPPDTYVKTYLRTGTRRVQKRKTATVKGSYNPEYHAKLKYNACNVMGRRLQVTVWQRAGKFEKNQCIGEAFIQLDHLTLTQHTLAWYKLFREKLVESEFYDSS